MLDFSYLALFYCVFLFHLQRSALQKIYSPLSGHPLLRTLMDHFAPKKILLLLFILSLVESYSILTLAGGSPGYVNGNFASAKFSSPTGICLGQDGNIFFADNGIRIRMISPNRSVSDYAGGLTYGVLDGVNATFNGIKQIACDPMSGSIYVADSSNNKIRKIDSSRVTSTVVGTGVAGDVNGPFASAQLNRPFAIAFDSVTKDILIMDGEITKIKILSRTGFVQDFNISKLGFNATEVKNGIGLTTNGNNVFVAERRRIWRTSPAGTVLIVPNAPSDYLGFTVDSSRTTYTTEITGFTQIISESGLVSTLRGDRFIDTSVSTSGGGAVRMMMTPKVLATDGINVYVSNYQYHTIEIIVPCDGGFYVHTLTKTCRKCPVDTYSSTVQFDISSCLPCPSGNFSAPGSPFCSNCPAGTYLSSPDSTCSPCAGGTFSAQRGSSSCSACAAGTFSDQKGSLACSDCAAGQFSKPSSTICSPCTAGTFSRSGSSFCETCPGGGFSGPSSLTCSTCPAGTSSLSASSFCVGCPWGTYSVSNSSRCEPTCGNGFVPDTNSAACIPIIVSTSIVRFATVASDQMPTFLSAEALDTAKKFDFQIVISVSAAVGGGAVLAVISFLVYRRRRNSKEGIQCNEPGLPLYPPRANIGMRGELSSLAMLRQSSGFHSPYGSHSVIPGVRPSQAFPILKSTTTMSSIGHTQIRTMRTGISVASSFSQMSGTQCSETSFTAQKQKHGKTVTLVPAETLQFLR